MDRPASVTAFGVTLGFSGWCKASSAKGHTIVTAGVKAPRSDVAPLAIRVSFARNAQPASLGSGPDFAESYAAESASSPADVALGSGYVMPGTCAGQGGSDNDLLLFVEAGRRGADAGGTEIDYTDDGEPRTLAVPARLILRVTSEPEAARPAPTAESRRAGD